MKKYKCGVVAGVFDIIHPGYIEMFEEAREICDYLVVCLHVDPSVERPEKPKPILPIGERIQTLLAIKYVDVVLIYLTEYHLEELLKSIPYDVRILGADYIGRPYVGDRSIPVHYCNRDHGWSTTKFKQLIAEQMKGEKK